MTDQPKKPDYHRIKVSIKDLDSLTSVDVNVSISEAMLEESANVRASLISGLTKVVDKYLDRMKATKHF